jgi:hypothetical protein
MLTQFTGEDYWNTGLLVKSRKNARKSENGS